MLHFCSMLHLCSVLFSYAAVLDLHDSGQNMLSSTCSYLVRCVAFNAPCMQHRGSAGSGRLTAIPDSQGLGASHLNGVLFWKKAFRVATLFCWKLVPWELPEVIASHAPWSPSRQHVGVSNSSDCEARPLRRMIPDSLKFFNVLIMFLGWVDASDRTVGNRGNVASTTSCHARECCS